jgi:hypothetical protein
VERHSQAFTGDETKLTLIANGANLGYAAGNNVGIRYALSKHEIDYVWILNNDTVVAPGALGSIVNHMDMDQRIGICGSKLLYYFQPERYQAAGGGIYNRWLGTVRLLGTNRSQSEEIDVTGMSFVNGAAAMVSRSFLSDIGLMCEDYFLYFEELDWATRARGKYLISFCPESIVFHKEGASLGTSTNSKTRSDLSDYYGIRNRLLFTRKFFPYALPTVYLGLLVSILNRLQKGQLRRAVMILKVMLGIALSHEIRKPRLI